MQLVIGEPRINERHEVLHPSNDAILAYCNNEREAMELANALTNLAKAAAGPLRGQLFELIYRCAESVQEGRNKILEAAQHFEAFEHLIIDGDTPINDNQDDGYWITCRVFIRYPEKEEK